MLPLHVAIYIISPSKLSKTPQKVIVKILFIPSTSHSADKDIQKAYNNTFCTSNRLTFFKVHVNVTRPIYAAALLMFMCNCLYECLYCPTLTYSCGLLLQWIDPVNYQLTLRVNDIQAAKQIKARQAAVCHCHSATTKYQLLKVSTVSAMWQIRKDNNNGKEKIHVPYSTCGSVSKVLYKDMVVA